MSIARHRYFLDFAAYSSQTYNHHNRAVRRYVRQLYLFPSFPVISFQQALFTDSVRASTGRIHSCPSPCNRIPCPHRAVYFAYVDLELECCLCSHHNKIKRLPCALESIIDGAAAVLILYMECLADLPICHTAAGKPARDGARANYSADSLHDMDSIVELVHPGCPEHVYNRSLLIRA